MTESTGLTGELPLGREFWRGGGTNADGGLLRGMLLALARSSSVPRSLNLDGAVLELV